MQSPKLTRVALLAWVSALGLTACGSTSSTPTNTVTDGVQPAQDLNPDPDILEVELRAATAAKSYGGALPAQVWTYNASIPGPLLDAKQGDQVIVHFRNDLPEPTTIHWHGIRLPASMDGSLAMQNPIEPGESFTYSFTLKDAGLFWFHPHLRADIQVQRGLYGLLRVRGPNEPAADQEEILVLDDIRLKPDGTLDEYLDDTSLMMGREGNTLLVNGAPQARLSWKTGLVRLRLVNTANGRFFNLRVPSLQFRVIGTDGGLIPKPYDTETLLIAPGERYDAMLFIPADWAGRGLEVINEPHERGHGSGAAEPLLVARVGVVPNTAAPHLLPTAFPELERLPGEASSGKIEIELDEMSSPERGLIFTINGRAYPDVPAFSVPNGELHTLIVENHSEMDHPFHLHGFFFQVLERNGVPELPEALANKDTLIIPAKSKLKLLSLFDEPGMWMYHCHILEHAEFGMMGEIHVGDVVHP